MYLSYDALLDSFESDEYYIWMSIAKANSCKRRSI